jgi:hypothetical protein
MLTSVSYGAVYYGIMSQMSGRDAQAVKFIRAQHLAGLGQAISIQEVVYYPVRDLQTTNRAANQAVPKRTTGNSYALLLKQENRIRTFDYFINKPEDIPTTFRSYTKETTLKPSKSAVIGNMIFF